MKPARQIESAKLMIASSVNSASFVRALLLATKCDMLVNQRRSQKQATLSETARTHFTQETEALLKDLKPDAEYEAVRREFDKVELVKLTLAIGQIYTWNRIAIDFHAEPRKYQPQAKA
jgi:alkylhydroperoxidase family enzyme